MNQIPSLLLFVPANRPERYTGALGSGTDAVIVDIEDAVAPGTKSSARAMMREALRSAPTGAHSPACPHQRPRYALALIEAAAGPDRAPGIAGAADRWSMHRLLPVPAEFAMITNGP